MWEVCNSEGIICQFLGIMMESHYVEQANGRWESFERAEAASRLDCSRTRLIVLIFCSPVFKVVLHHSEIGIRCVSMFPVHFTAPLHIPGEQIRPLCFQMSKILCCQTVEGLRESKTRWIWSRNAMAIMSERWTQREFFRDYNGVGASLCPVCHYFLDGVLGMPFGTSGSPDFSFHPS